MNGNVLIGKIDSNQQISWIKVYGGTQEDLAYSACQAPGGGYAVLAYTESNDGDVAGYKGGGDMWLLKIDAAGNLLWQKTYGSTWQDIPMSITNTPDRGFILSGTTDGSDVPFHYGALYTFDWLVIKTDSIGNRQWSKDIGTTGDEENNGAILSVDSFYYLISATDSSNNDCTDTAWHAGIYTKDDYYVLKLNDTGKVVWDSSYGGSYYDVPTCAMFDTRDSTIVIGGTAASPDYMVTGSHGGQDMWVIKVNKNGTLMWQKALGSPQEEGGQGICAAHNNGYMVYGSTTYGPIGGEDAWIFEIDSRGDSLTSKIFWGTENEQPHSVLPYLTGYVAVGYTGSSVFTEGSCNVNYSGAFVSYIDTGVSEAIAEVSDDRSPLKIFPNPSKEWIEVSPPEGSPGNLTFINSIGQTVGQETIQSSAAPVAIDISQWSNGLYLAIWQSENGIVRTTKFIKN